MVGKIDGMTHLAKTVRAYAYALLASGVDSVRSETQQHTGPTFGDKESGKKKKKKKSSSWKTQDEVLIASLDAGGYEPAKQELAELAEQAKLAMQQAEQLAGEPVAYIAGMIVPLRLIASDSPFMEAERYKIINEW